MRDLAEILALPFGALRVAAVILLCAWLSFVASRECLRGLRRGTVYRHQTPWRRDEDPKTFWFFWGTLFVATVVLLACTTYFVIGTLVTLLGS